MYLSKSRFIMLSILLMFTASLSFSQEVKFSNTFTRLDEKDCPVMKEDGQLQNYQRCPLFGHYYMLLTKDNYDKNFLTLGNDSLMFFRSVQLGGCGISRDFGPSVEWRLANGVPFAGIVTYHCLDVDSTGKLTSPIASFIVAFGLQGFADIDIELDLHETAHALDKIRKMTDEAYLKHFEKE